MRYTVHLKYPIMYWDEDHLCTIKIFDCPKEPHIIEHDGERYIELPRYKYRIDEDPTRGSRFFVPITYYSLDDTPDVDLEQ